MRRKIVFFILLATVCCQTSWAMTAEIEAGMELPVSLAGAQLRLNFSKHLFGVAGIGYTPSTVTNLLAEESYLFGQMNRDESVIVGAALEKALYLDFRLGYDFDRDGGIYIQGGYSAFINGGGSVSGGDVEGALNLDLSSVTEVQTVHVESNIYNVTMHIGYSWFFERYSVYLEGGLIKPIFASSLSETSPIASLSALTDEAKIVDKLDSLFVSDHWIITSGIWISYNF